MPRRAPESVQEIRYEYSLGPKEQGVVEEFEQTLKYTNHVLTATAIIAPIGLVGLGYGIYKAGEWIGTGLSQFSLGVNEVLENTPLGKLSQEASNLGINPMDAPWYIRMNPILWQSWIALRIKEKLEG